MEEKEGGDESIVLQWCGHAQPLGAISKGRYVRVEFMSDKNNPYQYTGVHLQFKTFASTDCAPSWNASPTNFCFKILNKEADWSSAQKACNAENANLASVISEEEHEFLLKTFGSAEQTAWIGLSDIAQLGSYEWIDGSKFSINKFPPNHGEDQYSRCVSLHFPEETWQVHNCELHQSKPLCKSNRGKKTNLFPIPQEKEEDNKMPTSRVVAIVVAVVALVIFLIIGICIYRRLKARRQEARRAPKRSDSDPLNTGTRDRPSEAVSFQHRTPTAPPTDDRDVMVNIDPNSQMVAPPTYEDALSHPVVPYPPK